MRIKVLENYVARFVTKSNDIEERKQSDSFLQSFTTSWCKQVLRKFPDFYFLIRYKQ